MKFLALIRATTLLYQFQRPVKSVTDAGNIVEYIESTREDVELAGTLITEVLGRSLDELPPQTRRLLLLVDGMVSEQCQRLKMERTDYRFSRRDVRRHTRWSDAQLKRHLHKLEELEYLIVHRGGRGQSFVYELYFECPADPSQPFLAAGFRYDGKKYGPESGKDGPGTAQVRGMSGAGASASEPMNTGSRNGFHAIPRKHIDTGASAAPGIVAAVMES